MAFGNALLNRAMPMKVCIAIDGEEVLHEYIPKQREDMRFFVKAEKEKIKVEFKVNQTWKPSDMFGSGDERDLGIALYEIKFTPIENQGEI
jgi:hypothetical protein